MPKRDDHNQLEFLFTGDMPKTSPPAPAPPKHIEPKETAPKKKTPAAPPSEKQAQLQEKANLLLKELMEKTGFKIRLTITNNTSSIISSRFTPSGLFKLNMHLMFLDAPQEVRDALGVWLKKPKDKASGAVVNQYIRQSRPMLAEKKRRAVKLNPMGKIHNLRTLYDEVNAECFGGTINAPIGWGQMPAKMPRRSIRFGSYDNVANCIRIHPLLDQDYVPRYYVKFVVFHEMLHADMGITENESGRRSIHPPEFRRREKAYHEFDRASAWEKERANMNRIFSSRKRR